MRTWEQIRKARRRRVTPPHNSTNPPLPEPWSLPKVHPSNCLCADCFTAAQRRADYEKAKALQELL